MRFGEPQVTLNRNLNLARCRGNVCLLLLSTAVEVNQVLDRHAEGICQGTEHPKGRNMEASLDLAQVGVRDVGQTSHFPQGQPRQGTLFAQVRPKTCTRVSHVAYSSVVGSCSSEVFKVDEASG